MEKKRKLLIALESGGEPGERRRMGMKQKEGANLWKSGSAENH